MKYNPEEKRQTGKGHLGEEVAAKVLGKDARFHLSGSAVLGRIGRTQWARWISEESGKSIILIDDAYWEGRTLVKGFREATQAESDAILSQDAPLNGGNW